MACCEQMSSLLERDSSVSSNGLSKIISENTVEGIRGKAIENYETFLPMLVGALMSIFSDRAEAYVGSLQSMCHDAGPRVKAEAALLLA